MITVKTEIAASIEKVWECWTQPKHITQWNFASDDWCCPTAENNVTPGGEFVWRMEAKDGSVGFDFSGKYAEVEKYKSLIYILADERKVEVEFAGNGLKTVLTQTFEPEQINSEDLQKAGWQAILENFRGYVEKQK